MREKSEVSTGALDNAHGDARVCILLHFSSGSQTRLEKLDDGFVLLGPGDEEVGMVRRVDDARCAGCVVWMRLGVLADLAGFATEGVDQVLALGTGRT